MGANGDFISYNLFSYCGNNPVNCSDPSGHFWKELWEEFSKTVQQASGVFAFAGGITQADSPLPGPADMVGGAIAGVTLLACLGIAAYSMLTAPAPTISIPRSKEKEQVIAETDSTPLYIYRHNGTNPGNLVPTNNDVRYNSGLSFSMVPMPNSWQTTVGAVNSTGVLFAVVDGPSHVSVYPIGGTVLDWRKAGTASIWTQALIMVSTKVK